MVHMQAVLPETQQATNPQQQAVLAGLAGLAGFFIVPLDAKAKYPKGLENWQDLRLDPGTPEGLASLQNLAEIHGFNGYGVLGGLGIIVLDFDSEQEEPIEETPGYKIKFPRTTKARNTNSSRRQSFHLFYRIPKTYRVRKTTISYFGCSIDVIGNGGQAVIPPTPGRELVISWEEMADCPSWLLDEGYVYKEAISTAKPEDLKRPQGLSRNSHPTLKTRKPPLKPQNPSKPAAIAKLQKQQDYEDELRFGCSPVPGQRWSSGFYPCLRIYALSYYSYEEAKRLLASWLTDRCHVPIPQSKARERLLELEEDLRRDQERLAAGVLQPMEFGRPEAVTLDETAKGYLQAACRNLQKASRLSSDTVQDVLRLAITVFEAGGIEQKDFFVTQEELSEKLQWTKMKVCRLMKYILSGIKAAKGSLKLYNDNGFTYEEGKKKVRKITLEAEWRSLLLPEEDEPQEILIEQQQSLLEEPEGGIEEPGENPLVFPFDEGGTNGRGRTAVTRGRRDRGGRGERIQGRQEGSKARVSIHKN